MTTAAALVTVAATRTSEHLPANRLAVSTPVFDRLFREQGVSLMDAAIGAAKLRVRPIIMTAFAFILGKTRTGRHTYAIGSNEFIAKNMGINVDRYKFLAFLISGIFFGFSLSSSSSLMMANSTIFLCAFPFWLSEKSSV